MVRLFGKMDFFFLLPDELFTYHILPNLDSHTQLLMRHVAKRYSTLKSVISVDSDDCNTTLLKYCVLSNNSTLYRDCYNRGYRDGENHMVTAIKNNDVLMMKEILSSYLEPPKKYEYSKKGKRIPITFSLHGRICLYTFLDESDQAFEWIIAQQAVKEKSEDVRKNHSKHASANKFNDHLGDSESKIQDLFGDSESKIQDLFGDSENKFQDPLEDSESKIEDPRSCSSGVKLLHSGDSETRFQDPLGDSENKRVSVELILPPRRITVSDVIKLEDLLLEESKQQKSPSQFESLICEVAAYCPLKFYYRFINSIQCHFEKLVKRLKGTTRYHLSLCLYDDILGSYEPWSVPENDVAMVLKYCTPGVQSGSDDEDNNGLSTLEARKLQVWQYWIFPPNILLSALQYDLEMLETCGIFGKPVGLDVLKLLHGRNYKLWESVENQMLDLNVSIMDSSYLEWIHSVGHRISDRMVEMCFASDGTLIPRLLLDQGYSPEFMMECSLRSHAAISGNIPDILLKHVGWPKNTAELVYMTLYTSTIEPSDWVHQRGIDAPNMDKILKQARTTNVHRWEWNLRSREKMTQLEKTYSADTHIAYHLQTDMVIPSRILTYLQIDLPVPSITIGQVLRQIPDFHPKERQQMGLEILDLACQQHDRLLENYDSRYSLSSIFGFLLWDVGSSMFMDHKKLKTNLVRWAKVLWNISDGELLEYHFVASVYRRVKDLIPETIAYITSGTPVTFSAPK